MFSFRTLTTEGVYSKMVEGMVPWASSFNEEESEELSTLLYPFGRKEKNEGRA